MFKEQLKFISRYKIIPINNNLLEKEVYQGLMLATNPEDYLHDDDDDLLRPHVLPQLVSDSDFQSLTLSKVPLEHHNLRWLHQSKRLVLEPNERQVGQKTKLKNVQE